ncbi:Protein of unknown function, DUF547 [Quillaja saponaria]|uniref:Uncharacterized protein n=1 Tax=Quillaja saponaria TaxID=32244 RepID=A0AAD7KSB1_QUISA|nr:Protein of unknown function, DUF547 [Quillaja saponaria]
MGGFVFEEEKAVAAEAVEKRENVDALSIQHGHAQHKRSKSASDRNENILRDGVSHSIKNAQNETHVSPSSPRTWREQSPLRDSLTYINKSTSSNHRASLEKDIEQLQSCLQQEKSMRIMLERAMGRASSTLSPGHRHFATQTKGLITEIELLEEEVANREQHVLTLYRSIFKHSVSQPPSGQNSGMVSPAHIKHDSRKHPSIISSAFCSSKKFPLRPLQALISLKESGNRISKPSHGPSSTSNIQFEKTFPDPIKVRQKFPTLEKASMLRTLKDHLYQCPSKLSEEMVRCMAAVYCWLGSATSVNPEKNRSPLLSRSSTNAIQPRRGVRGERECSCKSVVEISWISTDKSQFSHASYAINHYRVLVEQLERVNISELECDAQIAFWINVYNALVMHAYLAYGIPHSSLRRLALFHKAAYNIGGQIITANAIEQSIFCFKTARIGRWLENIVSAALRNKSGEERQLISSKFGLPNSQPLVCFSLCTGALSDPVLKVYSASNIREELEVATREFLQANLVVKKSRKVFLPKVIERYAREASISSDDLLKWVMETVDKKLHDSIQKCIDSRSSRKASQVIDWLPYSSRFRYMLAKDLTDKPWWV